MGLSRLENFLKSVRGEILYVDPSSLDSTDSIENQGNSLTRPFKTLQRALIEAARFSHQTGKNNDKFGKTTILLYPGDHIIDNRPGLVPNGDNIPEFTLASNFDLSSSSNELYKFNSVYGGVIIPRGTSVVGLDLRKTKIRPKYIPDPTDDNVDRSSIFRVTGACYFWQFSVFDADPNDSCYKNPSGDIAVPNFSHHKLSVFEYADGVNDVPSYTRTDLQMYYEKVGLAYGPSSDREIDDDYPSAAIDIEPKIDEYRIVGSTGQSSVISAITSSGNTVTVTLSTAIAGLEVDTPIRITGVPSSNPNTYNGNYVVYEKISDTQFRYKATSAPGSTNPNITGLSPTVTLVSDTVNSASPYIFNCSLRSVYGMCGLLADGDKASGFKSMVIAQFTGIGLQKDDNAFVVYDPTSGTYTDNNTAGNENISTNSLALFKPEYRNFHIKCINDAFIQNVSVFAIGYAEQFVVESGGDQSITNSNSNFGAKALVASGFRKTAFTQDDKGYITHIIPPKEINAKETSIEFYSIDVDNSKLVANNGKLYLYNQTNKDIPPDNVIQGYRIGARPDDTINVNIGGTEYSAKITSTNYENVSYVGRSSAGINSITSNTLTFKASHSFQTGEIVRIISNSGQLPDGLIANNLYYVITTADAAKIKLAKTQSESAAGNAITINNSGGELKVVSRVSDKNSGDIGHPIQWDGSQWYVNVETNNSIYNAISSLSIPATPRSYIKRKGDNRASVDKIYRARYVIPKDLGGSFGRPPGIGFILQESNNSTGATSTEIAKYFESGVDILSSSYELRNFRFIANATWDSDIATITTELPHNLKVGDDVQLLNITSTNNPSGDGNSGYNGSYSVISIESSKKFSISLETDPGTFTNNTSDRNTSLPYFRRKKYNNVYYVYQVDEHQKYISTKQDGIYYLTLLNSSNSPLVEPFTEEKFSQPVRELYPQTNRDYPISDPDEAKSFALSSTIGEVVVDDVRNSITKETTLKILSDTGVGLGITNIVSTSSTIHTIHTSTEHGFGRITKLEYNNISEKGANYGSGSNATYYNARLVGAAGSTTGDGATVKVRVEGGNVVNFKIMDGGSAYGIGNTLSVVGIATTTGHVPVVLKVAEISNSIGGVVRVVGVSSENCRTYNNLYRITSVNAGDTKKFTAISADSVSNHATTGIGSIVTQNSILYHNGPSAFVSSIVYTRTTGIATVTTTSNHGLLVNNKVKILGATNNLYNGDFVIKETPNLTNFVVNIGIGTTTPSVSGTIYAYPLGLTSNDGEITVNYENLGGRMVPIYAGFSTTISATINNSTDVISITNTNKHDINVGDYFQIEDEIVRIKSSTYTLSGSNPVLSSVRIYRGVLGSKASSHNSGTVIKKILVKPVELRRHSILRASGHTFEYVGFGPGNYSTAFPDKQDRLISGTEELLAQSTRREGGVNFYTGMNDKGISYSGNKKLISVTGKEEIFDTPVPTVTGEDISNIESINLINSVEGNFSKSITVEGGPDNNSISQFKGPIVFEEKVTSTSTKGLEVNSLLIQGENTVSRKYTVGDTEPTFAGNPGDVQFNSSPSSTGYLGWVYTTNNEWEIFSKIGSIEDLIGVGVGTPSQYVGFSTLINFKGTNINIIPSFGPSGISTFEFVGLSTSQVLSGYNISGSSGNWWNAVPTVAADGGMEIGRYIDFHNTSGDTSDYTFRLDNGSVGLLTAYGDLRVLKDPLRTGTTNGSISLGGNLNLLVPTNKYIDFYTESSGIPYVAYLRLVNALGSTQKNAITMHYDTGEVRLYYGSSERIRTTNIGVDVTGIVTATSAIVGSAVTINSSGINVTGIVTATSSIIGSNVIINSSGINVTGVVTATDINSASDISLKTNIHQIENPLDKVVQIRGVDFDWKSDNRSSSGVIAQEIEKILPHLVTGEEIKTVNYNGLIGVLIEAVKELSERVKELESKIS